MKIKVIVQQESFDDESPNTWETIDEIYSEDKFVVAWALRAIANRYDPAPAEVLNLER